MTYQKGIEPIRVALCVVIAGIIALFVYNIINRPPNKHVGNNTPWVAAMSQGDKNAKNTFIDYTDYFCSFCSEVEKATSDSSFKNQYIASGKLRYEHRVIALLKDKVPNTEQGAEAAYCAADQQKYWEYTHHIVPRIKADYFDKGIGVKNVAVPQSIPLLPRSYFETSAQAVGMNVATFSDCMKNEKHKQEIATNTDRALRLGVNGLPYMVVNDYIASGFGGGQNGLTSILKAGGVQ